MDYGFGGHIFFSRLNYFLTDLKLDDSRIQKLAGELYKILVFCNDNYLIKNIWKIMKNYPLKY